MTVTEAHKLLQQQPQQYVLVDVRNAEEQQVRPCALRVISSERPSLRGANVVHTSHGGGGGLADDQTSAWQGLECSSAARHVCTCMATCKQCHALGPCVLEGRQHIELWQPQTVTTIAAVGVALWQGAPSSVPRHLAGCWHTFMPVEHTTRACAVSYCAVQVGVHGPRQQGGDGVRL